MLECEFDLLEQFIEAKIRDMAPGSDIHEAMNLITARQDFVNVHCFGESLDEPEKT